MRIGSRGRRSMLRTLRAPARESERDWGAIALPLGTSLIAIRPEGGPVRFRVLSCADPDKFVGEVGWLTADEHVFTAPAGVTTTHIIDPNVPNQLGIASDSAHNFFTVWTAGHIPTDPLVSP